MANEVLRNEEERRKLVDYLISEMTTTKTSRASLMEKLDTWRRQREARPNEEVKDFPWKGASNVAVPLAMVNTNGVFASLKASFSQKVPMFNVESNDATRVKHAKALGNYLNLLVESRFHLNMRDVNNTIFYEVGSLGTQFVEVPWLNEILSFKRREPGGGKRLVNMTKRKGPGVNPIPIEDFWAPVYITDLQRSPWIGICHRYTWAELKEREAQGAFENVDEVKEYYKSTLETNRQRDNERIGASTGDAKVYEIYEFYVRWVVDDEDDVPDDLKVWVELDSGVILREEFNELGPRPLVRIPFLQFPGSLYGMGVGWIVEYLQDSADALFNMAINSTHISSLQMFATKRGSGIGAKERFRPFKNIPCDDPKNDFVPVVFPNTAQPNMAMLGLVREFADRAVGMTNALTGMPDTYAKSRTTASGTMFLAQQGNRLFEAVQENVEEAYSEMIMYVVFQMAKHKDELDLSLCGPEDEILLQEIFDMPIEDIHLHFNFRISTTEIDKTEEAKRQSILTLAQLYSMYGEKVLQLIGGNIQLMLQLNPQGAQAFVQQYQQFSQQFLVGSTHLMDEMLEFFNADKQGLLPYVRDIEMMLEMMKSMKEVSLYGYGQAGGGGSGGGYPGGSSHRVGGPPEEPANLGGIEGSGGTPGGA